MEYVLRQKRKETKVSKTWITHVVVVATLYWLAKKRYINLMNYYLLLLIGNFKQKHSSTLHLTFLLSLAHGKHAKDKACTALAKCTHTL